MTWKPISFQGWSVRLCSVLFCSILFCSILLKLSISTSYHKNKKYACPTNAITIGIIRLQHFAVNFSIDSDCIGYSIRKCRSKEKAIFCLKAALSLIRGWIRIYLIIAGCSPLYPVVCTVTPTHLMLHGLVAYHLHIITSLVNIFLHWKRTLVTCGPANSVAAKISQSQNQCPSR